MSLFGLSPLFFSVIASKFFTDPTSGILHVADYTSFIALFNCIVYLVGFVFLRSVPCASDPVQAAEAQSEPITRSEDENAPLISPPTRKDTDPTIPELLKRRDFWLLGIFCMLILGLVSPFHYNIVKFNDISSSAK